MLDIRMFREQADLIRADHDRRGLRHDAIDEVIRLDEAWRKARYDADQLRRKRNEAARGIAAAKKAGDDAEFNRIKSEVDQIATQIEALGELADKHESERDSIRMSIPNILHPDVPEGDGDGGNTQHSIHGEKPKFDFDARTHNDLIEMNKWVDLPRAAKISGSRFYFLKGDLAHMELALQQYAVDFISERGYTFVQPPVMMNREAYEGVTDLADFESVMYNIQPDGYYTIATSEHPLTAMFMDEVIEPSLLPIRIVGVSPCFRREVGAHGQGDKGIWRVHQFTKIEQIIISHPDESWEHHEELLTNCIDLWDSLGLHYEVVNICTGDMGTVAAKKYDLEAWLPGRGEFKEIVSCSNCTDYQANRLRMRFRTNDGNATVHTLNSTAVATSRALVAIMEQNQLADGRVRVPDCLVSRMGGKTYLEPCGW
ncbi:MAG: serine--tRNA ligase [Candidatus Thermoplasmatota archaeon]|nr:serine--tRNA ligase [Euryarchaeota archaeon]MEC7704472.1 serine--tRNA ligase [Candidatus Thermoplasmatota archaeon]MEC9090500.1 serine--tRNA ligase [Candidatus Thermoplasmatota archaeon]MED5486328.1 serine--tRNA ligase [Candidatus Thermoplasmatota archaeon]